MANTYFYKCACGLIAAIASAALTSGCSPIDSFKSETIRINDGDITIKGWIDQKKSEFCVKIELKRHHDNVSLHSLNVVRPDGTKLDPHHWKDQTPRRAAPRVSLGFGIPIGGGGGEPHGEGGGHGGGRGGILTPGFSVPLGKDDSGTSITKVTACWPLAVLKGRDISECDMEVNLSRMSLAKISIVTLTMAMAHHQDEEKTGAELPATQPATTPATQPAENEDDTQSVKDLISEIDFTQKGPVKTRSLDV